VEQSARSRLANPAYYGRWFERISVQFSDGVLTLRGRLPTFYLKQVLQTLLRNLEGVERIDNRVEVTNSAPRFHFPDGRNGALAGLDRIRNARALLRDHGTPLPKRLADAAVEFLSATQFADQWPEELRAAANRIQLRLLSAGDVLSSIRAMDELALKEAAGELLGFAKAARRWGSSPVRFPRVR
jgi:hypothetical protein